MDAFAGAIGVAEADGKCSPVYSVLQAKPGVDPRFYAALMRHVALSGYITSLGKGVRERSTDFRWVDARNVLVPLPPPAGQRRIADFLDRETAQIDELIAKQEQLISTLAERQAEEAAHLLTRGVDANSRKHETDLWWAPRIPGSWTVVPVRYLARIRTGSGDTQDAEPDGEYNFYVRSMTVERSGRWEFQGPAVLTSGDGAGVGKVFHLAHGRFSAHQRVYVLDQFRSVSPEYFFYYFSTFFGRVVLAGTAKSTVESLRRPMVGGLKVTVPPAGEQMEIVKELQARSRSYELLTEKARGLVETLRERRQALISAAVTGQIDVGEEHPDECSEAAADDSDLLADR